MKSLSFHTVLLLFLLVITATAVFFVNPYRASNLDVIPDSVEYAIVANHFSSEGALYIKIDGKQLPSRYPPWFSIFILSPSYFIFGNDIGNAIYSVIFFGIAGVLVAFFIGRSISGNWGGILSSMALITLPLYREHTKVIMTDIPCTALTLLACYLFLRLRTGLSSKPILFGLAGIVGALSGSIRPVSTSILIPFIFICCLPQQNTNRLVKCILLLLPSTVIIFANLIYNNVVFGSPFRNGYNFWCPVPFDYSHLCFSISYIGENLKTICLGPIPALFLSGIIFFLLNKRFGVENTTSIIGDSPIKYFLEFTIVASIPIIAVHLLYFYQAGRFYLPVISLLTVISTSLAGKWLQAIPEIAATVIQSVLAAGIIILRLASPSPLPFTRMLADQIAASTPENSIIISSIDPAYFDFFVVKSTHRRIIPLTRNVEYASKVICPRKINNPIPPPSSCTDHRCEGLRNGGAKDVIPLTASEGITFLLDEAKKGTPIFLETSLIFASDVQVIEHLQVNFDVISRGNYFYQLILKTIR